MEKKTKFEPSNAEGVKNKAYLDTNLSKIEGQISYIEKDYNEFKLHHNKYSAQKIPIERAVKTTIQILYETEVFDIYDNADEILKFCLLFGVKARRRPDLGSNK